MAWTFEGYRSPSGSVTLFALKDGRLEAAIGSWDADDDALCAAIYALMRNENAWRGWNYLCAERLAASELWQAAHNGRSSAEALRYYYAACKCGEQVLNMQTVLPRAA